MTIEEIRKNAPQGATHYLHIDGIVIYYKYLDKIVFQYAHGELIETLRLNTSGLKPL
ncbi:hypothetical protein AVV48_gp38 [Acinetobacter phage phiAC-1]|uniref:hypothetical protein n=1 Tax=Acinetobacter phage phiAC-1 TaxID=1229760 RepID=UPI00028B54D9|nr:hypothetical protein AVV48_gp38 [Acinetobacter phage phiAC-1]AFU62287.1 hypothetical protein phiAC-1_0038 [Acinetobacter phage phiAC-1]